MPYPTAIVEIAFDSGPYVESPTWTDVTSYVRDITTRRGRPDEFQDFGSGSATIVLDNRDRRFDPLNAAGPYAGKLLPRKQIRVRAEILIAGVMQGYDAFRGYVSGWPVTLTDAGFDSTVTLECFDALGLLATEEIPEDLADTYILSLSPRHYWPLTDPADPGNPSAYVGLDYGSTPVSMIAESSAALIGNSDGLAEGLPNTSLYVARNSSFRVTAYESNQGLTNLTITQWGTYYPDDFYILLLARYGDGIIVRYDTNNDRYVLGINDGTNLKEYYVAIVIDTGIPHHIALVLNAARTTVAFYVDGVAQTVTLNSTTAGTSPGPDFALATNRAQQYAVFSSQLTASEIQTIYRLSRNILSETSAARFTRLIGYTSFPSGLTSAPASPVATVGAFTTGGPSVATELEIVSDSEGGNLYVTKAGVVTMTGRNEFATGTSLTSQATIGTTGISIGTALEYRVDAETMRNQLAVGYSGEGSVEVTNAASVSAYGVAGGSITTQLNTSDAAKTLGQFLVGFSKDPAVVISPVDVNVSAVAADWGTVLGLELLDRITLTVQPRTGASFTQQQLIQSIEHRVIPGQWATTLNGSVRFTNPFIIGSSLLGGTDLLL